MAVCSHAGCHPDYLSKQWECVPTLLYRLHCTYNFYKLVFTDNFKAKLLPTQIVQKLSGTYNIPLTPGNHIYFPSYTLQSIAKCMGMQCMILFYLTLKCTCLHVNLFWRIKLLHGKFSVLSSYLAHVNNQTLQPNWLYIRTDFKTI